MSERYEDVGWWQRLPYAEASGGAFATWAEVCLGAANDVRPVIERVWPKILGPVPALSLRDAGKRVAESKGARSQLAGYLFEHLDTQRHNLRHLVDPAHARHFMKLCESTTEPGYDAFRSIGGELADGIQHKLCVDNIRQAIARLEARWPGSAQVTTFRVPSDLADKAASLAGDRALVEASEFSHAQVCRRLDRGAKQLARDGGKATSRVFQTARAGAKGGVVSAAIGGAFDAPKLYRREMKGKHFLARRGADAVEGAATAVATAGAVAATTSAATAIATAGGTGAATAVAVLSAPAWVVPVAAGLVVGGGVYLISKPFRRRIDAHFTSETVPPAASVLVEDLDAYRPRPWVPAAAAAMLVAPALTLWTPNPLSLWRPGRGGLR